MNGAEIANIYLLLVKMRLGEIKIASKYGKLTYFLKFVISLFLSLIQLSSR